jgi:hypothetical protein
MNYETLENAIALWAAAEDTVQALVAIGSRARKDHTAENWQYLYPYATESRIREWIEALLPL